MAEKHIFSPVRNDQHPETHSLDPWLTFNTTKDPILDKDTGLVPVMHARGTSGSAKWICCIGKQRR